MQAPYQLVSRSMSISIRRSHRLIDASRAWPLLDSLSGLYPDLADWYWNKAVPGIVTGHGALIVAETDEDPGNPVIGLALGRKPTDGDGETKLQCVRVAPGHQRRGIGARLLERAFAELGSDQPFCSVSEEMLHLVAPLFINRFGFTLTRVGQGIYRPDKLEYQFNGDHDLRRKTPYGAAA